MKTSAMILCYILYVYKTKGFRSLLANLYVVPLQVIEENKDVGPYTSRNACKNDTQNRSPLIT